MPASTQPPAEAEGKNAGQPRPSREWRLPRRALTSVGEQTAFSAFQFSPVLAATLSDQTDGLAWTAAFTACLGIVIAVFRGAVVQPLVRDQSSERYSAHGFVAATGVLAITLLIVGATGAFHNAGTLVVLGASVPIIGFVEMNRAIPTTDRNRIATAVCVGTAAVVVTLFPLYANMPATPLRIAVIWSSCLVLVMVRFALSPTCARLSLTEQANPEEVRSLTTNNLVGQLAAQGPILLVATILGPGALSAVQAARIPFRPVTILAAALPVHYLPFLVETRDQPGRWGRSVQAVLVASVAIGAMLLAPALLILPRLSAFSAASPLAVLLALLAALAAIGEATLGVVAIAAGNERAATSARLAALGASAFVLGGIYLFGYLNVATAIIVIAVSPAVAATAISRAIRWT